ncbi:MAG: type VII toxin-antitoxin system HepT family RNase toxin [Myxococcota bacterium]
MLWRAYRDLERYRDQYDSARFLSDHDAQRMVLHAMYEASQASIDLGVHLLVHRGEEAPSSYQEVFTRLESAGLISQDLARRMRGWAGLRNVLAHFYPVVDMTRVEAVLRNELVDLSEYARALTEPARS